MNRSAVFTKHRGLALGIAEEYRVPGMEPDDVRQEALLGLWLATAPDSGYDKTRGPFGAFARTVVTRHCLNLLRAQTRKKRLLLTHSARDEQLELVPTADIVFLVLARERLREALASEEMRKDGERRRRQRDWKRASRARARATA